MRRISLGGLGAMVLCLGACAGKQLSPSEIASLKGGTTTVVVYGFCIPINHIIKTTMTRSTLDFVVDGQSVGTIQTCSHATFSVKSGYWDTNFRPRSFNTYGATMLQQIYRPGATQYLEMSPSGYGFTGRWATKDEADRGIAEIKKIAQVF